MKGSRRTRRPYARPASTLGRSDAKASRLSSLAGAATVERLEPRQLLFSLTITPSDLVDNDIGQVQATFGYTIPYLFPIAEVEDDDDPQAITEDFNDEIPQGQNVLAVPSPFNFQTSGVRITHNVTSGARMAVRQQGFTAFGEGPGFTETALATQLLPGEQFSLFFRSGQGSTANIGVEFASMDIYGYTNGVGIDSSRMRVELRFQGAIVTSYTGAALLALNQDQNSGVGNFEFTSNVPGRAVFDEIRFVSFAGPQNAFAVDNVSATAPAAIFGSIVEERIFGAQLVFSGPIGSTIRVLDLYGREMVQTIALGVPQNGTIPLVDLDSDGIPNFNDGIGRIEISGADARTSLSIVGGTITTGTGGGFVFELIDNINGLFDDFEGSGFGFLVTFANGEPEVIGLPDAGGSVVVGSPYVRPQNNYNPGGFAPGFGGFVGSGFTNANQGIFVTDGSSVGSVSIHGAVFGSSQFTGAVETLAISYPLGSFSVTGDLGSFISAVDTGLWAPDPDATDLPDDLDTITKTNATLSVGRTLGQIHVGGRSLMDVSVLGDLSNPTQRPLLDSLRYRELESVQAIDPNVPEPIRTSISAALFRSSVNSTDGGTGQAYFFADGYLRNDSILSAEFINGQGTSVIVSGNVGRIDPVNSDEDAADVFAFAVDGTTDIRVELNSLGGQYVRMVDQDGRILGANSGLVRSGTLSVFTVTPPAPGVYYIIVMAPGVVDGNAGSSSAYQFTISGLAPVTFGALRTVGSLGQDNVFNNDGNDVFIQTLGGSMGSIRVGTGYWASTGGESDPAEFINTVEDDAQDVMFWGGGTVSIQSNLYNITLGSDLNISFDGLRTDVINVFIGGDFGNLVTGLSTAAGAGTNDGLQGDVGNFTMSVGGRIGVIDIRGSIGVDRDGGITATPNSLLSIRTGTAGGDGSIGMFRVGGHVFGPSLSIQTSEQSIIGAFLVSQDIGIEDSTFIGVWGQGGLRNFETGFGSDVRFVDAPEIDINSTNTFLPIIGGQVLELIDDGGAKVFIQVVGATAGLQVGLVRFLNVDSSQGVAIAEIQVDLAVSGQRLDIVSDGRSGTPVSIGRITITDAVATSSINITGSGEIDVWRISQTGGLALEGILNSTPNGDLIAVDVLGLGTLELGTGDLGRTEVVPFGPRLIGPYLGLAEGLVGEVGGELGIPADVIDQDWNGEINRPAENVDTNTGEAFLDDVGSPFDGYLNGLVVRGGNVISVIGDGALGDIILQGAAGELIQATANADGITPQGRFEGIVGTIFAFIVSNVEVGDGLLQRADSPFSTTGIFALNEVRTVIADNIVGATISGTIGAANSAIDDPINDEAGGISVVEMRNGRIIDAFIFVSELSRFWEGVLYGDDRVVRGDIRDIIVRDGDVFRMQVFADNINRIQALGGVLDAILVEATGDLNFVTADEYRNSTLGGTALEFFPNAIIVDGNMIELTVNGSTSSTTTLLGTMKDLTVDVVGNLTLLNASDIIRLNLDVDAIIFDISTNKLRASSIRSGELVRLRAFDDIVTSTISISGPVSSITAADAIINTSIVVSGPRGQLDTVSAASLLSGSISSSGPIGSIVVSAGDLNIDLRTITADGNVGSISATRDVILTSDVSGTIGTITAGRNIGAKGRAGAIVIRGDVQSVTAGSALYYDVRVGQSITGGVSVGAVMAKPGNNNVGNGSVIAFGRINQVTAAGDFGGSIISWSGGIGSVVINGSFYKNRTIAAYAGSIDSITINQGHLLGNVHADRDITSLRVVASADGVFGDVGVNPTLSAGTSYDARRNQLPVGVGATVGIDGPRITAGRDIVSFVVTNGSVFETLVHAGRNLVLLDVTGSVHNSAGTTGRVNVFAAGDGVQRIRITGALTNAFVGAGIVNFGADNLPGGTGADADLVKSGTITGVTLGSASLVDFVAGMNAGADGVYIGGDDLTAVGLSSISNISIAGAAATVRVSSDAYTGGIDARAIRANLNRATTDNQILAPNIALPGTAVPVGGLTVGIGSGVNARFELTGGGTATWNAANRTLYIANTGPGSTLRVFSPNNGTLNNFNIVSRDDVSIGTILVQAPVTGNSSIKIDGNVGTLALNAFNSTGTILIGGALGTMTTSAAFSGGFVDARTIGTVQISGFLGSTSPGVRGEASISALEIGNVTISGSLLALISSDRDIASVIITGSANTGVIRSGGTIGAINANTMSRTWVSALNGITALSVAGDVFDSSIMAGVDLGRDGAFGGVGRAADITTTGNIGTITIGGNFRESDIVAGISRGTDGFFGTTDDLASEGRATIGSITITGNQTGSNVNSESYLIAATGSIGTATIGGLPARSNGNLKFGPSVLAPVPLQVTDLRVTQSARIYTATLTFNLPIDASTLSQAISVSEVRGTGDVTIRLVEGIDYTVSYNVARQAADVTFSRSLTDRNLPRLSGLPGPGVYRFELDQSILRGSLVNARLDGNGDGVVELNENYSQDDFVGDAGDKLVDNTAFVPGVGGAPYRVDFLAPFNLDIVLDNNRAPDGVADANVPFIIRGSVGDHPDNNLNFFGPAGDVDLYKITLQAGQILRLGQMDGSALFASRVLIDPNGTAIAEGGRSAFASTLPVNGLGDFDLTSETAYHILQTGEYYIAIANVLSYNNPNTVSNIANIPGAVGNYLFSVQIFDDGDSGFNGSTDAGDGTAIVNAPVPLDFAGPDRLFGTADDLSVRIIGGYTFTLNNGPDGIPNTADDVVTGTSPLGVTSTYTTTVVNGQTRALYTSTISSAIGPTGARGVPGEVWADVDIFHLNNRQTIAAGTRLKITVKLADLGADLGSRSQRSAAEVILSELLFDYRGFVQFGLFDTTNSVGLDDAELVFSPTEFTGREGIQRVLADNGINSYGFDANGDFYIDFITPGALGSDGTAPAKYAVYIQGAFNTDYQIEVLQYGGVFQGPEQQVQNILLETRGGSIEWLQVGGITLDLGEFDSRILGYAGNVPDGRSVDQFLLDNVIQQLTSAFNAAGVQIRISTNASDFEFEDYSTVFLTSTFDTVNLINTGFNFFGLGAGLIFNQPFGYSQRSDPLNTNLRDESVVFVPSTSLLGNNQSVAELTNLSQSLTAAVGRRVGEMLGLRISDSFTTVASLDIMAGNSVTTVRGQDNPYRFSNLSRSLSSGFDTIDSTNFFLGRQRSVSLLDRILAPT